MIQKGDHPAGRADVIIVTHKAREKDVQAALDEIARTEVAQEKPFVLRVEEEL
jgi:homoserine dehydrogenase